MGVGVQKVLEKICISGKKMVGGWFRYVCRNFQRLFHNFFSNPPGGFLRKNSLLYFQFWQEVRHSWLPKVRNLIFWKKKKFDRRRLINFCTPSVVSVLSWKMHAIVFYNYSLEVNIIIAYYIDDAIFSFVKKKKFRAKTGKMKCFGDLHYDFHKSSFLKGHLLFYHFWYIYIWNRYIIWRPKVGL